MSRKPNNKAVDGVMLFWHSLSTPDQLECLMQMMRHLVLGAKIEAPATKPRRGGERDQKTPPLLSGTANQ